MLLKKNIATLLLCCIISLSYAQLPFTVYNDGLSTAVVKSGITVTILGNFISQTKTAVDGQIDNQSTIQITGNWTNNNISSNVFPTNAGSVIFYGSTGQTIEGTTSTSFNNLEINNSSASGITVSKTFDISGALTLTDGIVNTNSSNILTVKAGGSSSSGSLNSFVDGPMKKEGTTAFVFPLGDGAYWARLGIGAATSSSTFQAQYHATPYSDVTTMAGSPTPVLVNVSIEEYWSLTRTVGTGDATVTLYWEDPSASGINDLSDLRIANYTGSGWENNHDATTVVTGSASSSGSIYITDNATAFDKFTFGSKLADPVNPLPIELLSFTAKPNVTTVDLNWSTAAEINNDYFTVEKSMDGINFEIVSKIISKADGGNSTSVLNYTESDPNPFSGISYYRLKQTDFDGKYSYSNIVAVEFKSTFNNEFVIYPNPLSDSYVNLSMTGLKNKSVKIVLNNIIGKEVFFKSIVMENDGQNTFLINLPEELSAGLYMISVITEKSSYCAQLIIK